VVIEGALASEAAVLRDYVAAQLRVFGGTRGRYVLPSALRAALPAPPTLNIAVSTRATSALRGDALPPPAPPRPVAVPVAGGGAELLLTAPAVATAPVGRRHVAPPAPAPPSPEEKKGEEERGFFGAPPPPPLPLLPPPPPASAAALRAAVAAAEAERQAALVASGRAPPPPPAAAAAVPRRSPPRAAAAAAPRGAAPPPFSLPPLPPPPRAEAYATPGAALEAALAVESPGALLEGYVSAAAAASARGGGRPASASSELLSRAAGNVGAGVDPLHGGPRIGEVGDRRALAHAGAPGAPPTPAPPPAAPYALAAAPRVADFGALPADGRAVELAVTLTHHAGGGGAAREAARFRVADRALLAPHARAGNSVRVRHDGGPLAPGAQRALTVSIVPREPGEVALLLRIVTETETLDVPVHARVVPL
jgi:hypothetical protein